MEPDATPRGSRAQLWPRAADCADVFGIRRQVMVPQHEPLRSISSNSQGAQIFAFTLLITGHQGH